MSNSFNNKCPCQLTQAFFFFRHEGRNQKIVMADIAYVESQKNYVRIVTHTREYQTIATLKQLQDLLPPDRFVRIHRSFVVSLDWIQSFDQRQVYGRSQVLPIGEKYARALRAQVILLTNPIQTPNPFL